MCGKMFLCATVTVCVVAVTRSAGADGDFEAAQLQRYIEAAVAREDYGAAADLHDQLVALATSPSAVSELAALDTIEEHLEGDISKEKEGPGLGLMASPEEQAGGFVTLSSRYVALARAAQIVQDQLEGKAVVIADECKCRPEDTMPWVKPRPDRRRSYPDSCLSGWCGMPILGFKEKHKPKFQFVSLDGDFILKFTVPRNVGTNKCTNVNFLEANYGHLYCENQASLFIHALESQSNASGPWDLQGDDVVFASDMFPLAVTMPERDDGESICSDISPAFLSKRVYGKMIHSPQNLGYDEILWHDALQECFKNGDMHKIQIASVWAASLLRLEMAVAKHSLLFNDLQFLFAQEGVRLFDTMVTQAKVDPSTSAECGPWPAFCHTPNCLTVNSNSNLSAACLKQTQVRNLFLVGALEYLMIAAAAGCSDPGDKGACPTPPWKVEFDLQKVNLANSCKRERMLLVTNLPALLPDDAAARLRSLPGGEQLVSRIKLLSREQGNSSTGYVCAETLHAENPDTHMLLQACGTVPPQHVEVFGKIEQSVGTYMRGGSTKFDAAATYWKQALSGKQWW
jgi:hypothetical protein